MELIIGGAFQGKTEYAKNQFPEIIWKNGEELSREELMNAQGVLGFHLFLRKELEHHAAINGLAEEIYTKNPSVILVSDEIGYGVVPVDAFERQYREAVGRVCTRLAVKACRVTRIYCGIAAVIKEAR